MADKRNAVFYTYIFSSISLNIPSKFYFKMRTVILISFLVIVSQAVANDPSGHDHSEIPLAHERHILPFVATILAPFFPKPPQTPQQNGTESAEWSDDWSISNSTESDEGSISNSTEWSSDQKDFAESRARNMSSELKQIINDNIIFVIYIFYFSCI